MAKETITILRNGFRWQKGLEKAFFMLLVVVASALTGRTVFDSSEIGYALVIAVTAIFNYLKNSNLLEDYKSNKEKKNAPKK